MRKIKFILCSGLLFAAWMANAAVSYNATDYTVFRYGSGNGVGYTSSGDYAGMYKDSGSHVSGNGVLFVFKNTSTPSVTRTRVDVKCGLNQGSTCTVVCQYNDGSQESESYTYTGGSVFTIYSNSFVFEDSGKTITRIYVKSSNNEASANVNAKVRDIVKQGSWKRNYARNDIDGDGRSDIGWYYAPNGHWYIQKMAGGFYNNNFGFSGTVPINGDFDGDGVGDFGCYYPPNGSWIIYKSSIGGIWTTQFGFNGTLPITGDFDGDGIDDFGCYFPPTGDWFIFKSREGFWQTNFGYSGTLPITGDFDGDGVCDFGCYHPGYAWWYLYKSSEGFCTINFGQSGTVPVTGDFDGDGICDFAYFKKAVNQYDVAKFYTYKSTTKSVSIKTIDLDRDLVYPIIGDFDGDGRSDYGVSPYVGWGKIFTSSSASDIWFDHHPTYQYYVPLNSN